MNSIYRLRSNLETLPKNSSDQNQIVCVIANFGFAKKAHRLKISFQNYVKTYLVDASSPETPLGTDFVIKNDYYPGLLQKAIDLAEQGQYQWLLFIASDVEVLDYLRLQECITEVITDRHIGVYTPTVSSDSRCAYSYLFNQQSSNLREVGITEGFIFLAQLGLLKALKPYLSVSKFGWGLDLLLCYAAYAENKVVVADDRCVVFHPRSKSPIDEVEANDEINKLLPRQIIDWKFKVYRNDFVKRRDGTLHVRILRKILEILQKNNRLFFCICIENAGAW